MFHSLEKPDVLNYYFLKFTVKPELMVYIVDFGNWFKRKIISLQYQKVDFCMEILYQEQHILYRYLNDSGVEIKKIRPTETIRKLHQFCSILFAFYLTH